MKYRSIKVKVAPRIMPKNAYYFIHLVSPFSLKPYGNAVKNIDCENIRYTAQQHFYPHPFVNQSYKQVKPYPVDSKGQNQNMNSSFSLTVNGIDGFQHYVGDSECQSEKKSPYV